MSNSGAPTGDEQTDGQTRGVTRRSVVRTGTTAAWSVPVITVLAAAPAHAASGFASMTVTGSTRHVAGQEPVTVSGTVKNVGDRATVNLQLTVVLTGLKYGDTTSSVPSGWTLSSTTRSSADKVTFVYTSTAQLQPAASQTFSPVWTLAPAAKSNTGSASIAVTTTGGQPGSATWAIA